MADLPLVVASLAPTVIGGLLAVGIRSAFQARMRRADLTQLDKQVERAMADMAAKVREADEWNRRWDASLAAALAAATPKVAAAPKVAATPPDALTVRRPSTPTVRCDSCPMFGCAVCVEALAKIEAEARRKAEAKRKFATGGPIGAIYVAERVEPVAYIDAPGTDSCPCSSCNSWVGSYEPPSADRVRK